MQIEESGELNNGLRAMVVRGLERATVGTGVPGTGRALWVQAEPVVEEPATERAHELAREYKAAVENILDNRGASALVESVRSVTEPTRVADLAGYSPDLSIEQKVEVLETIDVEARLEKVVGWAKDTLADHALKDRIRKDVTEGMDKTHRDFLLRQQLAAIRKELGDDTSDDELVQGYRDKVDGAGVPEKVARPSCAKSPGSSAPTNSRPSTDGSARGSTPSPNCRGACGRDDNLDLVDARRVLDADHTGLDDVKDRIVEHLAVRKLRAEGTRRVRHRTRWRRGPGAILALVGPPGVGKTSLGESVARAMGRTFVRVALGGVRDEAEIRGHRRTYVGAMPGRIVRAMKEAGTMNPVMLLDEIDKLGTDWRGDPVVGVARGARSGAEPHVPRPLPRRRPRSVASGVHRHRQRARHHPRPAARPHGDDRARRLHRGREAGHRPRPPRAPAARAQRARRRRGRPSTTTPSARSSPATPVKPASATSSASWVDCSARSPPAVGRASRRAPVVVDAADVRDIARAAQVLLEAAERTSVPGVATGLAVTGAGGDVLFIEATAMPGKRV